MPVIDSVSDLNLTNEVDLLYKHPNIKYLFLPYETSKFSKVKNKRSKLLVSHAPTNRFYKGSDYIIKVCKQFERENKIYFDLIENVSHSEALNRKSKSDIFIDQIGDRGGWGYGMNSVESLSMGICTLTQLNSKYQKFIPDHPFINVNKETLKQNLEELIKDKKEIFKKGEEAKKWVKKKHNIKKVADELYGYYKFIGLKV